MRVFLSWSGDRSRAIAGALRDWLPYVIHGIDFWMSSADIEAGTRWRESIETELQESDFGIICLTPENVASTWIHFEAGAISKLVKESRVYVYLHELKPPNLSGPLVAFQAKPATKEGTLAIVKSLNIVSDGATLPPDRLSTIFDRFWGDLEKALSEVPARPAEIPEPSRTSEDMLAELLELVRGQTRFGKSESADQGPSARSVIELAKVFDSSGVSVSNLVRVLTDRKYSQVIRALAIIPVTFRGTYADALGMEQALFDQRVSEIVHELRLSSVEQLKQVAPRLYDFGVHCVEIH